MAKPKKINEEEVVEEKNVCDCKNELTVLLKVRLPGVFDREPSPNYNANLDKLVDEIINLCC